MISLISPAYAEGGLAADGGIFNLVLLAGFVVIFYFLMWRPQAKRAKEHKNLIASLAKGTEVVTGGGVLGKVSKAVKKRRTIKSIKKSKPPKMKIRKPSY